jgi:RimJ/RimL family protein N-acetyltransferase
MKEALTALISKLSGHTLRLTASSANLASQRLAEAVGFRLIQTIPDARTSGRCGVCDTLAYLRDPR